MIKTVIIDDELFSRKTLMNLLIDFFPKLKVVGEADDIQQGIELIKQAKPDLVFLDVHLKSGTGFDLLKQIGDLSFELIFVTAHDEYAITAFQFAAFGYLLKPLVIKELKEVVGRFIDKRSLESHHQKRIKILIENYSEGLVKKIVVQNVNGFEVLELNEILYLEGAVNYTKFYLSNGKSILISKTLKEYETLLKEQGFLRVHQSFLINLHHVKQYQKGEGGQVIMSNQKEIPVSRRKKAEFIRQFIG